MSSTSNMNSLCATRFDFSWRFRHFGYCNEPDKRRRERERRKDLAIEINRWNCGRHHYARLIFSFPLGGQAYEGCDAWTAATAGATWVAKLSVVDYELNYTEKSYHWSRIALTPDARTDVTKIDWRTMRKWNREMTSDSDAAVTIATLAPSRPSLLPTRVNKIRGIKIKRTNNRIFLFPFPDIVITSKIVIVGRVRVKTKY